MLRETSPECIFKGSRAVEVSRGTKVLSRGAMCKEMKPVEETLPIMVNISSADDFVFISKAEFGTE